MALLKELAKLSQEKARQAARAHLSERHGDGRAVVSGQALNDVGAALFREEHGQELVAHEQALDSDDLLAGLTLVSDARTEIDFVELQLIAHARARGHVWDEIAAALGMPDRRQAQTRFRRLRQRWPGYEPPAPQQTRQEEGRS
ncbi:hypothetical protein [Streptomyces sp. N35]|uniref:hypothetical protein n=1 Tax=Streptomyces sp. N35 TaxID=2795730 RepID=UPI0018F29F4C|nr:hypothetical protein [Streptomyces sp. N35]